MNMITKDAGRDLAISYHGYLEACDKADLLGIVVMGECLLTDQEKTGIFILSPYNIRSIVKEARFNLSQAEKKV